MSRKKFSKEFKLARIKDHQEKGISFYKLEKEGFENFHAEFPTQQTA